MADQNQADQPQAGQPQDPSLEKFDLPLAPRIRPQQIARDKIRDMLRDPEFRNLVPEERRARLWHVDENFRKMTPEQQMQVIENLPGEISESGGSAMLRAVPAASATLGGIALAPETFGASLAVSGGFGALGAVAEQGIRQLTGIEPPDSFGEAAKRVGTSTAEQLVAETVGYPISWGLGKLIKLASPEKLAQEALRPTGTSYKRAQKSVGALLQERGISLSDFGAAEAKALREDLNRQIEGILAQHPRQASGASYTGKVKQALDGLRDKWQYSSNPRQYLGEIDQYESNLLVAHGQAPEYKIITHPSTGQQMVVETTLADKRAAAQAMSSARLQKVKKMGWEELRIRPGESKAFGVFTHPDLATQARAKITGALKRQIEEMYVGIADIGKLNEREGAVIELEQQLDRFVKREANKKSLPYFVFPAVGGALGGALGEHAAGLSGGGLGTSAGMLTGHLLRTALDQPEVKLAVARALFRARQIPGARVATAVGGRLGPQLAPAALRSLEYWFDTPPTSYLNRGDEEPPDEQPAPEEAPQQPRPEQPRGAVRPPVNPLPQQQLNSLLANASSRHGAPLALLRSIQQVENAPADLEAIGYKKGKPTAYGIMQMTPDTFDRFKTRPDADIRNPQDNVDAAARYVQFLNDRYHGDWKKVAGAYNAGEGAVDRFKGVPGYSMDYANRVMQQVQDWSQRIREAANR